MSEKFNALLKKKYHEYKNKPNPPVPLKEIKEYLELEGVNLEDDES